MQMIAAPSFAQDPEPFNWAAALESTRDCIARSEPDFERAISCYDGVLDHCINRASEYRPCLENAVHEFEQILPLYSSHELAEEIAMQYDPDRCFEFDMTGLDLPRDELSLQCQFTALGTQITAGHIASIWGGLPFQD
jgi:hypothetical protein